MKTKTLRRDNGDLVRAKVNDDGEIHVRTLGAIVSFDEDGHLRDANRASGEADALSEFEHDACVQYALRDTIGQRYALN